VIDFDLPCNMKFRFISLQYMTNDLKKARQEQEYE